MKIGSVIMDLASEFGGIVNLQSMVRQLISNQKDYRSINLPASVAQDSLGYFQKMF